MSLCRCVAVGHVYHKSIIIYHKKKNRRTKKSYKKLYMKKRGENYVCTLCIRRRMPCGPMRNVDIRLDHVYSYKSYRCDVHDWPVRQLDMLQCNKTKNPEDFSSFLFYVTISHMVHCSWLMTLMLFDAFFARCATNTQEKLCGENRN